MANSIPPKQAARLAAALASQTPALAARWQRQLQGANFVPFSSAEVRQKLESLLGQLLSGLLAEPFEPECGAEVGQALAELHYLSPNALSASLETLSEAIPAGVSAKDGPAVQARLGVVLARFAAGFARQLRASILSEQETIRAALLAQRDQAEAETSRAQGSLARAQELAHLGSWELDNLTGQTVLSDELRRIYGLEPQTPYDLSVSLQMVHPDDVEELQRVRNLNNQQMVRAEHEFRIIRTDGAVRYVHAYSQRTYLDEQVIRTQGTIQDITERKLAEAALRRAQDYLKEAQDIARLGSWELDHHTGQVTWSDELRQISGFGPDEALSLERVYATIHPDDRARVQHNTAELMAGRATDSIEFRRLRPDGALIYLAARGRTFRDAEGRPVRTVGVTQDITALKQTELRLVRNEKRLELALMAARAGVWEVDLETDHTFWTEGVFRLLGYDPESFIPIGTDAWLAAVHPDDRARVEAETLPNLPDRDHTSIEARVVWPDGSLHWVQDIGRLEHDAAGRPRFARGIVLDIDARKQAEQELRHTRDRLLAVQKLAGVGSWESDLASGRMQVSDEFRQIYGFTPDEVVNQTKAAQLIFSADLASWPREILITRRGDGASRYVAVSRQIEYDAYGREVRQLGAVQDITERKQIELQLRQTVRHAETLNDLAAKFNAQLDLDQVTRTVCVMIAQALNVPIAGMALADAENGILREVANTGWRPPESVPAMARSYFEERMSPARRSYAIFDCQAITDNPNYALALEHNLRSLLSAGLWRGDELIGRLTAFTVGEMRRFSPEEISLLESLADQAASAIINARLFTAERQARQAAEALRTASLALTQTLDLDTLLPALLEQLAQLTPFDTGTIFMLDDSRQNLVSGDQRGYDSILDPLARRPQIIPLSDHPLLMEIVTRRRSINLADIQTEPGWPQQHPNLAHARSWLAVPLVAGDQVLGIYSLNKAEPDFFTAEHERLAQALAAPAATAIQNARLYAAEQQARRESEAVREANLTFTRTLDVKEVLHALLDSLTRLVKYDSAGVFMLDESQDATLLVGQGYENWIDPSLVEGKRISKQHNAILRRLVSSRSSQLVPDTRAEPDWEAHPETTYIRSWLGVPLVAGDQILGLYSLDHAQVNGFNSEDVKRAEYLAAQAATAIQNARLFAEASVGRERMRALAQQVITVQDEERRRMSRELHDDAGQALIALRLALDLPDDPNPADLRDLRQRLDKANVLIQQTTERIRDLSHDWHPPALEAMGLNLSLEDKCLDWTEMTNLEVSYHGVADLPALTREVSISFYRLLQEALTNIGKHAQAQRVTVTLALESGELSLTIHDDGRGFDPAALGAPHGLGMLSMRERFELLNGRVAIESRPKGGTLVRGVLRLPDKAA